MVAVPLLLLAATVGFGASFWRRMKDKESLNGGGGVVVRINGIDHTFPLSDGADTKDCMYAAVQFCSEHGSGLGFTMKNFIDCVRPLADDLATKTHAPSSSSSSSSRRKGSSSSSSSSSSSGSSIITESRGSSGSSARAEVEAMPPSPATPAPPAPLAAAEAAAAPAPLSPQPQDAAVDNRVRVLCTP